MDPDVPEYFHAINAVAQATLLLTVAIGLALAGQRTALTGQQSATTRIALMATPRSGAACPAARRALHSARRFSASFIALKPCFVAANAAPPMISGSKSPEKYSPWVSCVMRGPA